MYYILRQKASQNIIKNLINIRGYEKMSKFRIKIQTVQAWLSHLNNPPSKTFVSVTFLPSVSSRQY